MHCSHTLYIDRVPVAEIEILVEPFLTWSDELVLELSVTDVDGQEHGIKCPELLSIILAKHRDELWRHGLGKGSRVRQLYQATLRDDSVLSVGNA